MAKSNVSAKKPKEKKKSRIKTWFREIRSELKKISWPSVGEVVAKTGIVLAVVAFFLVVVYAFDSLLAFLFTLLIG